MALNEIFYPFNELGMLDSNQRVQESKSCALPLGECPMVLKVLMVVTSIVMNNKGG